jgi:hypothetical protein
VLSIWDRLFRSYQAKPDYRQIRFGVEGFSGDWSQNFVGLMLTPIGPRIESQRAVPSDR